MTDKVIQPIAWAVKTATYVTMIVTDKEKERNYKGYPATPLYTLDQARIILDNEKKKSND
ncbi:MAG: hypothetical protein LIP09_12200 [Bacteroidales bacterium]|nr:hypothetical protein [Bacteroidales bacterium]